MSTVSHVIARLKEVEQNDTMTSITVRLPDDVTAGLDTLAEQQGTKRSALIRRALIEYLERTQVEATPA